MSSRELRIGIEGMTCSGCAARVRGALLGVVGVRAADVDAGAGVARVEVDREVPVDRLREAVGRAGASGQYRVVGEVSAAEATRLGEPGDRGTEEETRLGEPGHLGTEEITRLGEPGHRGTEEETRLGEPVHLEGASSARGYRSLAIIVGYIVLVSGLPVAAAAARAGDAASLRAAFDAWMLNFMGGFFLVFSFFKMLDLRGFAGSFRMYDPVARAVPVYARVYPFFELALGMAYVARVWLVAVLVVTVVVMTVGAVGISVQLARGRVIRCACLGTVIDLPLGKVSLFEDVLMAVMAVVMLVMMI